MVYKIDKNFLLQFGSNLKRIRLDKGITQAQLAIDCDFDVSMISRIERGAINTSINTSRIIADALDIEVMTLFNFERHRD